MGWSSLSNQDWDCACHGWLTDTCYLLHVALHAITIYPVNKSLVAKSIFFLSATQSPNCGLSIYSLVWVCFFVWRNFRPYLSWREFKSLTVQPFILDCYILFFVLSFFQQTNSKPSRALDMLLLKISPDNIVNNCRIFFFSFFFSIFHFISLRPSSHYAEKMENGGLTLKTH